MGEKINKFCYSKMVDIPEDEKANVGLNSDCDGCVYFDFCLKDKIVEVEKAEKVKKSVKKSLPSVDSEEKVTGDTTDTSTKSEPEVKTEVKPEVKSKAKAKKSKKPTLEDLVDEDIF